MKNVLKLSFLVLIGIVIFVCGQVIAEPILVDLGNEFSYRGVTTVSPDSNGNYWNSVWSGAYYPDMVDISGNATEIDFGFTYVDGTDSYNGPAGATDGRTTQEIIDAVDIDSEALGLLGAKEAAADYYVSSQFEIQGLDPAKTYNLTFFGSHKYSTNVNSVYTVYSDNTYAVPVYTVELAVQNEVDASAHNRDTVATMKYVPPQAANILYVGFFGYLNAIMIEEAADVVPTQPYPADGSVNVDLETNLSWVNPTAYEASKYVLSIVADEPNWPGATVLDPVNDINGDPMTTEVELPFDLENGTTYYWRVQAYNAGDPNEYVTIPFTFTTIASLAVDAGMDVISWLGDDMTVDLEGMVTCACDPDVVMWSVVSQPDGATVNIDDDGSLVTWASFDTVGTYVLKLYAQDSSEPMLANEDMIEVQVFVDACEAAQNNPAGYTPLLHDYNNDCKLDLADFADFALEWLTDYALSDNLEY